MGLGVVIGLWVVLVVLLVVGAAVVLLRSPPLRRRRPAIYERGRGGTVGLDRNPDAPHTPGAHS